MLAKCWAFAFAVFPLAAQAGNLSLEQPSRLCDRAAHQAAARHGVPLDVMLAIARVETGRRHEGEIHPWPWAVNSGGEGRWFDTRAEAVAFAESALASGNRNFDVGCFQINLRWHSKGFASLEDMFAPEQNADYAAAFLARLNQSEGGWRAATAAYHSRTEALSNVYIEKVETVLAGLKNAAPGEDPAGPEQASPILPPRENRFPLLRSGGAARFGSLVPDYAAGTPLFGGQP